MHSVRQILRDNWRSYIKTHNPTKYQRKEIQKMIDCSKNSCNCRICSSCGKRYVDDWAENLKIKLKPFPKTHVVLTIPSLLRPHFRNWRNLDSLIRSSKEFFQKINKNFGLVVILHTFGKDMKFHPHLHVLASSKISLRKFSTTWRDIILRNLKFDPDRHSYGYYLWSGCIKSDKISKYIARYARHPAIANGRIRSYNGKVVIFSYKTGQNLVFCKKQVNDFITSIIQHIPPCQFKIIRYYGVYSKNNKN